MSREYSVGLVGALRLVVPSGIAMKERIFVRITGDYSALTGEKAEFCANIEKNGGTCLLSRLKGENREKTLKDLEKEGIVEIFRSLQKSNLQKSRAFCALTEKGAVEGEEALSASKRLKNQLELLLYIKEKKEAPLQEIAQKSALKGLRDKGFVKVFQKTVMRSAVFYEKSQAQEFPPTREQSAALERIFEEYGKRDKKPVLLFGVTGSGKTCVYIKLIEKILDEGKEVIVLVPEIALTPLMTRRIYEKFGDRVTITHSRLSAAERFDQWKKAQNGDVSVVIGPRSAVFAPFKNLGAIIVDEEHEDAFQSENLPGYNAKDVALFRCRQASALYLAGSATPAVETFYRAEKGEYVLCEMKERALSKALPAVEITDMRKELREGNKTMFGKELQRELANCMEKGEQAMLFINRRGYSSFVSCRSCGYVVKCGHCSVSMTYHARENQLVCHYCGARTALPRVCPECGSSYIKGFGTGTERIAEAVSEILPNAKTLIMDADTTRGKFGHERILSAFAQKRIF